MSILNDPFEINIRFNGQVRSLKIFHETETFDFDLDGEKISLINNGDNSWSLVTGAISQEHVNFIGSEIEKHYENLI